MLRKFLLAALFTQLTIALPAQDKGFFRQIWLEEGLSQSSVTSITQDQNGFIWFGTQDGLNRYDGRQIDQYNFQPFNQNSISGDHILNLYPGKNNKLWILSTYGLDVMDLSTGNTRHLTKDVKFNNGRNPFYPYRIWSFGNTTFGYANGKLEKLLDNKGDYSRVTMTHNDTGRVIVYSMCLTKHGLFAGTNCGLFSIDTVANTYTKLEGTRFSARGLNMASKNDLLFITDKSELFIYNIKTGAVIKEVVSTSNDGLITSLLVDNRSTLWIGTTGEGIYTYSITDNAVTGKKHFLDEPGNRYSLKCNSITCFFQSKEKDEDNLWIGTRDEGAVCYSYSKNSFALHSASLENVNFFGTVKNSRNVIYSGTNNGLHILEPGKEPYFIDIPVENLFAQRPVESIYLDSKDRVWLGVGRNLYTVEGRTLRKVKEDILHNPKTHIMDMIEVDHDRLLIGTNTGLAIYDVKKNEITPSPIVLPKDGEMITSVGAFFIDHKKRLWIGSVIGLFCFENNKLVHHFRNDPSDKTSLLSDVIMDINESKKNEILVATTKGLSILVPAGEDFKIENYYKPDGLSNNFLYSVIPDSKGKFWMSTNYGICKFDPEHRTFRSFHAADGLYINEFNSGGAFAAADGELLFGGLGGLIGFYPEKLPVSKIAPRVLLKSVTIDEQTIKDDLKKVFSNLTYDKNNIQLEFSVIDFAADGKKKLLYKLNKDQQWMAVSGTNIITLANLSPGDYKLYVKAANRDGMESQSTFTLEFTIEPPFYQTWWFYSIVAIITALCGWGIYRYNLKRKIRALQERERIREEENEKLRKTAALDLHDEFGNGLTRISMLVELTRMKVADVNPDASRLLDVISDNSTRLYNGTKDYIWSINSASDNLYEVIIRIKDFGDEVFYERGIRFHVEGLSDDLRELKQVPGTGRNVAMIFKEALSNIVKHSNATEVVLKVDRQDSFIRLSLKDNGCGFSTQSASSGFGLGNMKQRASRINGEFAVSSEKGNGSEVSLTLKDYR